MPPPCQGVGSSSAGRRHSWGSERNAHTQVIRAPANRGREFHAGRTPQSMPRPVGSRQWVRMRITFLGHAGLYIETCHGSVLCDPWFTPAYFGSWFPFPRSDELDPSDFSSPDYLYISHSHRDHFDPEWLARHVDRRARVLLPDFNVPFLERELRTIGFHDFVNTRTGELHDVDGLQIAILAMTAPADGPLGDSALIVDDGTARILNQNDARLG